MCTSRKDAHTATYSFTQCCFTLLCLSLLGPLTYYSVIQPMTTVACNPIEVPAALVVITSKLAFMYVRKSFLYHVTLWKTANPIFCMMLACLTLRKFCINVVKNINNKYYCSMCIYYQLNKKCLDIDCKKNVYWYLVMMQLSSSYSYLSKFQCCRPACLEQLATAPRTGRELRAFSA